MATKGPSNRYGNSRGGVNGQPSKFINYEFAKSFMPHDLKGHSERHKDDTKAEGKDDYVNRAIKFANNVDKKNCKSVIDQNGTTYKYNTKTKELVIVNKNGIIVSYYVVSDRRGGFEYVNKEGVKKWVKV